MSVRIQPVKTSVDESNQNTFFKKIVTIFDNSPSLNSDFEYQLVSTVNVSIFSHVTDSLNALSDNNVKEQVLNIISSLRNLLTDLMLQGSFTNYLAKLHITEQEDKTALLEWNFEKFRFGFSIDPDSSKSGYYLVSNDDGTSDFCMNAGKIGSRSYAIVEKMVKYALENT